MDASDPLSAVRDLAACELEDLFVLQRPELDVVRVDNLEVRDVDIYVMECVGISVQAAEEYVDPPGFLLIPVAASPLIS